MKKIIQWKLKILAKLILAKYQPEIIGITGSVGKTSAKEAIAAVLATKFNLRKNIKNYNNEIGLPLTIIGADSAGKSIFGWLAVFIRGLKLIFLTDKNFPKILVLEMAADRPGDLSYLMSIVKCRIGVITRIGPVHLEHFGSLEKVQQEKSILVKKLAKTAWAVLNYDDEKVIALTKVTPAQVLTYGLTAGAQIRAQELSFSYNGLANQNNHISGTSFKLSYAGSAVPVFLAQALGEPNVYAVLAAAAVGIIYGFNLVEISQALKKYSSPKGRLKIIAGIKQTLIIDDTYNASPQSSQQALEILSQIPITAPASRYAVLGDMLELGSISEEAHQQIGKLVVKLKIDKLIIVGERARDIARGAISAGMSADQIFYFADCQSAGLFIQARIKPGDLILVKGSQGIRMEKIVKEIMAEPLRAKELLVRQGSEWEKR